MAGLARPGSPGTAVSMTAAAILDRLHGVRETGPGRWIARCPAHEDRSPSLSLKEAEDGKLLVKCFGGCAAGDVVAAVGLTLADLFPDRPERQPYHRPSKSRIPAGDLLLLLEREADVLRVLAADFMRVRTLDADGWGRLNQAADRIGWVASEMHR